MRLAVINCCEREFSIAGQDTPGAFELDPVVQHSKISEAKKMADRVIVIVHGGYERCSLPSPRMVRTYRFFIDAGADAVIGHHQHCPSGYEVYKGKPIFYGIGNLCFEPLSEEDEAWHKGYMVGLEFREGEEDPGYEMFPYIQCLEDPAVRMMDDQEAGTFLKEIGALNKVIASPDALRKGYEGFLDAQEATYRGVFVHGDKCARRLCRIGLIKPFLNDRKRLSLTDYVSCDAHRDGLLRFLHKK